MKAIIEKKQKVFLYISENKKVNIKFMRVFITNTWYFFGIPIYKIIYSEKPNRI